MPVTKILYVPGIFVPEAEVRRESCLKCGAQPGAGCRSVTAGKPSPYSHAVRCNAAINRKAAVARMAEDAR